MIMHLSAPVGRSVNNGIHPDEFSLHYNSVDNAVAILLHLGKEALMAKIDLKSAFHMIPVHCADWDLLGSTGGNSSTWTLACHLACVRPHSYLMSMQRQLN